MASTRDRESANANHGREPRARPLVFRLTRFAARTFLFPFFRVQAEGLQGFPQEGAFLLLPKHQRWEDIPLLGMTVSRPLFYVAKYELFQGRFSRWFISSLGGIPLNRKRPLESRISIRAIWSLLRRGEGIVIFPEGTYYPRTLGPGRSGLMRMICSRMQIPCIPVGIRYSSDRFRKSVRIVFGEPIYSNPGSDGPEFYQRIMREIAALSDIDLPPSPPLVVTRPSNTMESRGPG